ncbi:o-succinylbenzoate--CoA ligase [Celerinatantimonas yamalensis]|uniref:O-succinylbenzoate--CoA ligase n=1 Tax=Celerinatantimonas yamalensis TaxID=559956 RepID=A0ABW9G9L9_9GAMM
MSSTPSPLLTQLQQRPNAPFIFLPTQVLSYQDVANRVSSLINQLEQHSLPQGSRIGWVSTTPLHGILLQLACLHGGWVYCAISPHLRAEQYQSALKTLALDAIISPTQIPHVTAIDINWESATNQPSIPSSLPLARWVDLVLTSGSSGQPKAVIHSWQNLYFSALGSNQLIPITPADCWLASLPLFHVGGQALIWRALLAGASIAISSPILANDLTQYPISHLSLVPTQLYRLLNTREFSHRHLRLRHILVGGGPCNEQQLKRCDQRGFIAYMSYGSSEMSSQVSTRRVGEGRGAGQLLAYRQLRLQDGEILLRGETLSPGYFNAGRIQSLLDSDGWFHSGDCGQWQGEQLVVLGRRDHRFICGGENIHPEEIEMALLNHPEVTAAIVIAQPDAEYGMRPVAFIQSNTTIGLTQLEVFLQPKLSAFKRPVRYFTLPQQAGLKVQRQTLINILNQPTDCSIAEIL